MADIVYRFDEMRSTAAKVEDIAARYKAAAEKFQNDFAQATSPWEGASKDKMTNFITVAVNEYTGTTIPGIVNSLT